MKNYEGGSREPKLGLNNGGNIKLFAEKFTHGFVGGICEPDYGPIYEQALEVIRQACESFAPPG